MIVSLLGPRCLLSCSWNFLFMYSVLAPDSITDVAWYRINTENVIPWSWVYCIFSLNKLGFAISSIPHFWSVVNFKSDFTQCKFMLVYNSTPNFSKLSLKKLVCLYARDYSMMRPSLISPCASGTQKYNTCFLYQSAYWDIWEWCSWCNNSTVIVEGHLARLRRTSSVTGILALFLSITFLCISHSFKTLAKSLGKT